MGAASSNGRGDQLGIASRSIVHTSWRNLPHKKNPPIATHRNVQTRRLKRFYRQAQDDNAVCEE
jgi:hypothetical protein